VEEVARLVTKIGFKKKNVTFIPISGYNGENLTERSKNMPWYKGPILYKVLNKIKPPKRPSDRPLRIPVGNVYKI